VAAAGDDDPDGLGDTRPRPGSRSSGATHKRRRSRHETMAPRARRGPPTNGAGRLFGQS
jgi:hypothetical protein